MRINEEAIVKQLVRSYWTAVHDCFRRSSSQSLSRSNCGIILLLHRFTKSEGSQSTDSLSTRSKITWCMPNAMRNQRAVKEITKDFLEKHKKSVFSGIKKTSYSQTLDRLAKEDAKISFLT